jgi:hypothetical protein
VNLKAPCPAFIEGLGPELVEGLHSYNFEELLYITYFLNFVNKYNNTPHQNKYGAGLLTV